MTRPRPEPGFLDAYLNTLIALVPLLCLYVVANLYITNSQTLTLVSAIGQLYFIAVLLLLTYRVARRSADSIWTPMLWLPLQSAVFFGFGPLVEIFGNEFTQQALNSRNLALSAAELLRANLLSVSGIWFVLFGIFLHLFNRPYTWQGLLKTNKQQGNPIAHPASVAMVFLIGGGALKYGLAMPAQWGMLNIVVPGTLTSLTSLLDVGFGIVAYLAVRGRADMRLILLVGLPVHVFLSLLTFSKLQITTALLLPALGAFIAHRDFRRLAIWFVVMAAVFMVSQPLVSYGRAQIFAETGTIWKAGYLERVNILAGYRPDTVSPSATKEDEQGWWTRLNYAGAQAYAMRLHDRGQSGTSLDQLWLYFIPRFIWLGKPIIQQPGLAFYHIVTGGEGTTFLGLSIYGDLYWQFGWWGVGLGGLLIGLLFGALALRSLQIIKQRDFVWLPIVLIALQMAITGPTKFIATGIIGPLPIYFGYLLVLTVGFRVFNAPAVRKRASNSSSRPRLNSLRKGRGVLAK